MKIGLMSFAHTHALSYAAVLRDQPDVEVVASDPLHGQRRQGESGGRSLADELNISYVEDYLTLLEQVDAVIVCSENSRHREDVERAAAAGVHVLCEKPLATTTDDAEAMVAACRQAGVLLMVAFPVRFSAAVRALAGAIENGTLGEVVSFTGTNNGKLPSERSWFADPILSGGGALTDHVVHLADVMDLLQDGALPTSVYATKGQLLHSDALAETEGLVSLEYPGGVIATIDCSWSVPDDYPTWGGLTLQAIGTEGSILVEPFQQRVDGFAAAYGGQLWMPFGENLDAIMIDAFIAAVRNGRSAGSDGDVGVRTTAIVEAAYASVSTGQPVALSVR